MWTFKLIVLTGYLKEKPIRIELTDSRQCRYIQRLLREDFELTGTSMCPEDCPVKAGGGDCHALLFEGGLEDE